MEGIVILCGPSCSPIFGGLKRSRNGTTRVGEDTFEMYLRYRYARGCIFCIFQILRYRYH